MKTILKVVAMLFCLKGSEATHFRCDYQHYPDIKAWLKLHRSPATWTDAEQTCLDEDTYLALPSTLNHKHIMMSLMNSSGVNTVHTGLGIFITENYEVDFAVGEQTFVMSKTGVIEKKVKSDLYPFICFKSDSALSKCGNDDEYIYDAIIDRCYKFHRMRSNWREARKACMSEGGELAVINSEHEANVIRDIYAMNPQDSSPGYAWQDSAFLGFHMRKKDKKWVTVNGKPLSKSGYEKWSNGKPNNSSVSELCGSVGRNGLLFNIPCSRQLPYICEKETEPVTCDAIYKKGYSGDETDFIFILLFFIADGATYLQL